MAEIGSWPEYAKFFAAMMAIVNPVGALPILINLTASDTEKQRKEISFRAGVSCFLILVLTLLTGEAILRFFGISIASFRVGGGILILLMAISMLHAKPSRVKHTDEELQDSEDKEDVAVVPLATPLLAGPGAISTIILHTQKYASTVHLLILGGEILLIALITWVILRTGPAIAAKLGKTGINIVTRLMGLIMAAVGVEFIANGLKQLFPVLAG